jgi:hypothetical protein
MPPSPLLLLYPRYLMPPLGPLTTTCCSNSRRLHAGMEIGEALTVATALPPGPRMQSPSGSFCVRNTACLQTHSVLYKTNTKPTP